MKLRTKNFLGLCMVMAILPITQVHAEYYNNALGPDYRNIPTEMKTATDTQKENAIVTSIKTQGETGTCWAFATDAAVETSLMKQMQDAHVPLKIFNFSEKYNAWMMYALSKDEVAEKQTPHAFFTPTMTTVKADLVSYPTTEPDRTTFSNLSQGGNLNQDLSSLMGNFLIDSTGRADLQFYPKTEEISNNVVNSITSPIFKARDVYTKYLENNKMEITSDSDPKLLQYKNLLKATGSLRVNYTADGATLNRTTGAIYNPKAQDINHAILVVGYDDDYAVTNFVATNRPSAKGAWIVKNSWGSTTQDRYGNIIPNADAGFYYISYYDKTAVFDYATVIEPDVARYSLTDTHTPLYTDDKVELNNPTFASTYKPTDNQFIKAVSFFTKTDGASYTIEILKDSKTPDAKAIYSQSGTFSGTNQMSGYHTVDLSKFILLPKSDFYTIKVTVTAATGTEQIYIATTNGANTSNLTFKDGESYYKDADGQWADTNKTKNGSVILNGQSKETASANGGDFTVGSLSCDKGSGVVINLGKATEAYTTDLIHPDRKTLSNMTAEINTNENFYGKIIGEGGVTKTGSAELSFLDNNTYTGVTNVNEGTLNNYKSIESNIDVKIDTNYKIINTVNETTTQRGIKNEGTVFIAADKLGIINFANTSDILQGSTAGKWYLNTLDSTLQSRPTTGTIIIGANTNDVNGNVYLQGGTVKLGAEQTNLFTNSLKFNRDGLKIDFKSQPTPLGVNLGKMVIEGKTELDMGLVLAPSTLTTNLINGRVVLSDGTTDDNTSDKIKLGFTLDKDVTFTDASNGVSSIVAGEQIGKVVNNLAFVIDRNDATGSYNITYSYDDTAKNGTLKIVNAASAPISLQDAITLAVTSKYYALGANQVLAAGWGANLVGNDLTLAGNNATIDGAKTVQIFNVAKDKMLNLRDMTVLQGKGTAIYNKGALSLVANNAEVKLAQNEGTDGGAIYSKDSLTLVTAGNNIKFQENKATNGAGIYNDNDNVTNPAKVSTMAKVGDIVFDGNEATANGGAIFNKGDVSLWTNGAGIQLNNNKAQTGAGVYNNGYLAVLAADKNVEFTKNIATADGGGIANDGGSVEILTQGGSVNFSQNQALNGGAISNTNTVGATTPVTVDVVAENGNITFDGNIANSSDHKGGAIYNTKTVNILALDNQTVAFKQSTDSIYNNTGGIVNLNYNTDYGATQGLISTGAQLGGSGTYNLYGGQLAFVKATDIPTSVGSIANTATLSVMSNSYLNLANGIKETFNPGTLQIANSTALLVAIDCILNDTASEADILNAGTYTKGTDSAIIIAAVNLLNPNNETKSWYRIKISGSVLQSAIAENVMADVAGFRSAYSNTTGDLLLLSTSIKGLVDFVEDTDSQRTYSMAQDEMAIFPLGVMGGKDSTLTIDGNNNKIVSAFTDIDGITVSETNTLNANNVAFNNFRTAIINKGTLNLDNVTFLGASTYDVNNSSTMTALNTVSGKVLNSGTFMAGKQNALSGLTLRTVDGSILDLSNTENNVNLKALAIAGNVNLYINGTNKLSADAATRDTGTDSLLIKYISGIKSINTTVTETTDLKPFIKMADDVIYALSDAAKPSAANSYKLTYADGNIAVNSADLSDTSAKSGSYNVASSANFVASDSASNNTVAAGTTVVLTGATSGIEINTATDTTVKGTLGMNSLASKGSKIIVDNLAAAKLNVSGSTVNNEIVLNGGQSEVKNSNLNGDIKLDNNAALSFTNGDSVVNGAIIGTQGTTLTVSAPTVFNGIVDPVSEIVNSSAEHNANVSKVDFTLNTGGLLTFTKDSYLDNDYTNKVNFNGGSLNLMNGATNIVTLNSLSFAPATESAVFSNIFVDVDLANQTMDKLESANVSVGAGTNLNVAGMHLLSDATSDNTSINFTENAAIKAIVMTDKTSVAYSPIYQYLVGYDSENGNFDFARSINPAIMASSVAAQVGSYLTQLNNYEQAFGNMDMMMSMTAPQRQALKLANKYAAAGSDANLATFSPNQIPEQEKGLWYRAFTTIENVGLKNGPSVNNVAYGSLFGGDTPIIELKNGWDAVYTAYAGYNGSHQTYDGIGIYQNGATLGATGVFYKGNLFTGLTANVGANFADANTMYGKEDFTMLATGIASKTGYNFEFADGKFIIQPNYLMSYSFINTFNYTNAAGASITSDPLNAIQVAPGIKFIGNLKNGWQPYAVAQMVWNIMDQSKFSANDVSLPELSIKPFIQYGVGLQKRWGERFTGYGQVLMRSGGRNGVAFQFGFRIALGKAPKKTAESSKNSLKSANALPKKCSMNLQSVKSAEQIIR